MMGFSRTSYGSHIADASPDLYLPPNNVKVFASLPSTFILLGDQRSKPLSASSYGSYVLFYAIRT